MFYQPLRNLSESVAVTLTLTYFPDSSTKIYKLRAELRAQEADVRGVAISQNCYAVCEGMGDGRDAIRAME